MTAQLAAMEDPATLIKAAMEDPATLIKAKQGTQHCHMLWEDAMQGTQHCHMQWEELPVAACIAPSNWMSAMQKHFQDSACRWWQACLTFNQKVSCMSLCTAFDKKHTTRSSRCVLT